MCTSDDFAKFNPVMESELDQAYVSVLSYAAGFTAEWETNNSLDQGDPSASGDPSGDEGGLGSFGGGRRMQDLTKEERELCGCPCICAISQWLCDAYCGGGRRRLRASRRLSEAERASLEGQLAQNCANKLSGLNITGVSAGCLTALQGGTCQSEVKEN